jgi:hypothetical protein
VENTLLALDGKIDFDDNALYRHEDIIELRDTSQEDEKEKEASEYQLNYISLDGTRLNPTFSMACKIPSAIKSQRTIPPKIFTKTPPTFASV